MALFGTFSHSKLRFLLSDYKNGLEDLEASSFLSSEQILKLLLLRDTIQKTLESVEDWESFLIQELTEYDQRLQQYQNDIVQLPEYHQWKQIRETSNVYWWWNWELENKQTWWQKLLEGLGNLVVLICFGFSISLIIDAIPRILSGGIDQFSILSILIPSFLALVTTGKLTPIGEQLVNSIFSNYKNKKIFILILSLFLVISLVIIHENYNKISIYFNTEGEKHYINKQLNKALSDYNRAIAFNSNNSEAHYNLGSLYEDLQELDKAKTEYKIAGKQGNLLTRLKAYNNLGRIYLLNKKYQDAIFPLLEAYNDLDENKINNDVDFPKVHYMIHTNLAWANLGLKNYSEAKALLNQAITIYQNHFEKSGKENDKYQRKGKAYCLLAQVAEEQNNKGDALQYWENCIGDGNARYPEEYIWVNLANEKVK